MGETFLQKMKENYRFLVESVFCTESFLHFAFTKIFMELHFQSVLLERCSSTSCF